MLSIAFYIVINYLDTNNNEEILASINETTCSNVKSVSVQNVPTIVNQSTRISPERIFNSPTKIRLRKIHTEEMQLLRKNL